MMTNVISLARFITKEMILEAASGHELINQEPLLSVGAVTNEIYKVGMMQQTQHQHLHHKFLVPLKPLKIQLLHSYNLHISSPLIHISMRLFVPA